MDINKCVHTFVQVLSIRDNDVLASLVATELRADLLILLSDVEGLYSAPPGDPGSRLLHTYHPAQLDKIKFFGQSRVGMYVCKNCVCTYVCVMLPLHTSHISYTIDMSIGILCIMHG